MKQLMSLWVLVIATLLVFGCESGNNAEDIAEALEERLTDALDFEDGEVVEGTPPEGSGGGNAPQIVEITAPSELRLGDMFTVALPTNFANPEAITNAVVHVEGALRYILVHKGAVGSVVYLYGQLSKDEKLRGETFNIRIALQTADAPGMYKVWQLHILDEEPIGGGEPINGIILPDEEWHDSGRPKGSSDASAPQIEELINAPEFVYVNYPTSIGLRTADISSEIAAVLLTTPNNKGYKRTTTFTAMPAKTVYDVFVEVKITDEQFAGGHIVLLLALEDKDGKVGQWVPWQFVVESGSPSDGDEDYETPETLTELDTDYWAYQDVWTDTLHNLMWQVWPTHETFTWSGAKDYCENLDLAGYTDWRLPTISELRTIIRGCEGTEYNGACNVSDTCNDELQCWRGSACGGCSEQQGPHPLGCFFVSDLAPIVVKDSFVPPSCGVYWSATEAVNTSIGTGPAAWIFMASIGAILDDDKDDQIWVRCVRSVEPLSDGDEDLEPEPELEEEFEAEIEPEPELEPESEPEPETPQIGFEELFDIHTTYGSDASLLGVLSKPYGSSICLSVLIEGANNSRISIGCLNADTGEFEDYGPVSSNNPAAFKPAALLIDFDATLWAAGNMNIDNAPSDLYHHSATNGWQDAILSERYGYTINGDEILDFWNGLYNYQYYFVDENYKLYIYYSATGEPFPPILPDNINAVYDMALISGSNGLVAFFATNNGIYYTENNELFTQDTAIPLEFSVYKVKSDYQNTLWFAGTYYAGPDTYYAIGRKIYGGQDFTSKTIDGIISQSPYTIKLAVVSPTIAFVSFEAGNDTQKLYKCEFTQTIECSEITIPGNGVVIDMRGDSMNHFLWLTDGIRLYRLSLY